MKKSPECEVIERKVIYDIKEEKVKEEKLKKARKHAAYTAGSAAAGVAVGVLGAKLVGVSLPVVVATSVVTGTAGGMLGHRYEEGLDKALKGIGSTAYKACSWTKGLFARKEKAQ